MAITLRHLLRKNITTQYPKQRINVARRYRGQQFVWREDLCTGCATCAKSCPHGIIRITTSQNGENKYLVDSIVFDMGRCMYCGLCVEACPYNALYMGRAYEQAQYKRELVWADKAVLIDPQSEVSAYNHPELEDEMPRQTLLVYGELSQDMVSKEK
jgi:NADH-quinone oxidoreductase chain I